MWPLRPTDPAEVARDRETLEPAKQDRWLLAEVGSEDVGLALVGHDLGSFDPLRWQIEVVVLPENRRRGTGSGLFERAFAMVAAEGASSVYARIYEHDADARRFAESRGFRETKRDFVSVLDLEATSDAFLAEREAPLPAGGRVVSFGTVDSPELRLRLHALFEEVRVDIPRLAPPTPLSYAFFEEQVLGDPGFDAELSVLAFHGDRLIGMSTVYRGLMAGRLDQGLTAVRREWRGRGIAQALKVAVIRRAKAAGYATIATDNDARNAPMLAINESFGFVAAEALVTMARDLTSGS
ncbi:MAG: GNAT family N-acetyltransferase [Fimbriimonadaceae bacterium]|nr:GNAT family N-acetyltransferase [Fimbriimonadaceae bacterium]